MFLRECNSAGFCLRWCCLSYSLEPELTPFHVLFPPSQRFDLNTDSIARVSIQFAMRATFYTGAASLLWYSVAVSAADDCQPSTWNKKRETNHVGDIVCRYDTVTNQDVNYYTCAEINNKYELSMDRLVDLNPGLQQDCENVKPETKYCVKGCECSAHRSTTRRPFY
jgi:hypothetical protein